MRALAYNYSKVLLPMGGAAQDAAVAAALRLSADCGMRVTPRRPAAGRGRPTAPRTTAAGRGSTPHGRGQRVAACELHVATTGSDVSGTRAWVGH